MVLVESVFANAMSFKREREIGSKERIHKATKMNPSYILKRMRDLCQEFSHIQFLFVDGRDESSRVMKDFQTLGIILSWIYSTCTTLQIINVMPRKIQKTSQRC